MHIRNTSISVLSIHFNLAHINIKPRKIDHIDTMNIFTITRELHLTFNSSMKRKNWKNQKRWQ